MVHGTWYMVHGTWYIPSLASEDPESQGNQEHSVLGVELIIIYLLDQLVQTIGITYIETHEQEIDSRASKHIPVCFI